MRPTPSVAAATAGLAAGALGATVSEFLAAITHTDSPIAAVGSMVIDHAPGWLERWAIATFGTSNKDVLRGGIVVLLAVGAVLIGLAARSHRRAVVPGFATFGIIGAAAGAAVPSALGAVVGGAVLLRLVPRPVEVPGESRAPLGWDRRRFLFTTGGVAAAATAAGFGARGIRGGSESEARQQADVSLPPVPNREVAAVPEGAELGPTPFLTPTADFYRIDTALSLPRTDLAKWRLRIDGLVDNPLSLSYDDLRGRPQVERIVTISCVSNEVGGPYVGTAKWQGVMLAPLLEEAGVRGGAEQVFSTSLDGWTCGFPVTAALDGRDAMVVLGMNGAPLPLEHGFPARLVVPGLYGYVSATKWLDRIELAAWDREGYWIPRGWSRLAPVKTQSRIDAPRHRARIPVGPTAVAGVAWAPHRGISHVEVQVDDEAWRPARLGAPTGDDAWRQWVMEWDAAPGRHVLRVRATDGTGATQTAERSPVAPDGATGHHTIEVTVG